MLTRPDPTRQNPAKSWPDPTRSDPTPPDPTRPDPTRGSIRPVDNSEPDWLNNVVLDSLWSDWRETVAIQSGGGLKPVMCAIERLTFDSRATVKWMHTNTARMRIPNFKFSRPAQIYNPRSSYHTTWIRHRLNKSRLRTVGESIARVRFPARVSRGHINNTV